MHSLKDRGAVRIKCGEVSRLPSVFEGVKGPFSGLYKNLIPVQLGWFGILFSIFLGEVAITMQRESFP